MQATPTVSLVNQGKISPFRSDSAVVYAQHPVFFDGFLTKLAAAGRKNGEDAVFMTGHCTQTF